MNVEKGVGDEYQEEHKKITMDKAEVGMVPQLERK